VRARKARERKAVVIGRREAAVESEADVAAGVVDAGVASKGNRGNRGMGVIRKSRRGKKREKKSPIVGVGERRMVFLVFIVSD